MINKSIFVSSTFRDFQTERELLQNEVELRLREMMLDKRVSFVDLRWGIDTSQEKDLEKVVAICIAEVQNSRPYYVIMLGDSYGSTVEAPVAETLYRLNDIPYDNRPKSVTEVEIEATGLLEGNNKCAIVLSRTLTNFHEEDVQASALKEKVITAALPENTLHYRAHIAEDGTVVLEDDQEFTDFIAKRICEMLQKEQSEEESTSIAVAKWEASHFYGREAILKELLGKLSGHHGIFRVCGGVGSGLTATISKLYTLLNDLPNTMAAISVSNTSEKPFTHVLQEFAKQLHITGDAHMLLQALDPNVHYYFIIDDSDIFSDFYYIPTLEYKISLPDNVSFVLGARNPQGADFVLPPLTWQDREEILIGTLKENKKECPQEFREYFRSHICREMEASPQLLKSFITSICYLSNDEYARLGRSSDFMQELTRLFIEKMKKAPKTDIEYFGQMFENGLEQEHLMACVLAMLSFRISERDLLRIVSETGLICTPLHFYQLKKQLRENLRKYPDGSYELSHRSLEEWVLKSVPKETLDWLRYKYVQMVTQAHNNVCSVHVFGEVVNQLVKLNDAELLSEILEYIFSMDVDHTTLGRLLSNICGDGYRDEPSFMYLSLAKMNKPKVSEFMLLYGMPYISNLYIQNATELFLQMFKTLYQAEKKDVATEAYSLYVRSLSLNLLCQETDEALKAIFPVYNLPIFSPDFLISMYRVCCFQYNPQGCKTILSTLLRNKIQDFAMRNVLLEIFQLSVLLDGDVFALKEDFQKVFPILQNLVQEDDCKQYPMLMVGMDYLCHILDIEFPCSEALLKASNDSLVLSQYTFSVTMLRKYIQCMFCDNEEAVFDLAELVKKAIEDDSVHETTELFYLCKFFRRVCLENSNVYTHEFKFYAAGILFEKLRKMSKEVVCQMQLVELLHLSFFEILYAKEGEEKTKALERLSCLLTFVPTKLQGIEMELNYFKQDISINEDDKALIEGRMTDIYSLLE